jgi:hypothetical protein
MERRTTFCDIIQTKLNISQRRYNIYTEKKKQKASLKLIKQQREKSTRNVQPTPAIIPTLRQPKKCINHTNKDK